MRPKVYTVSFTRTDGTSATSRHFQTIRAARRWAAWLMEADYIREVQIWRGDIGGERVTL